MRHEMTTDTHSIQQAELKVKPQPLNDKALVYLMDKVRSGTLLRRCHETWTEWGLRGVADELRPWFEAIGHAFAEIEAALDINAGFTTPDDEALVRYVLAGITEVA